MKSLYKVHRLTLAGRDRVNVALERVIECNEDMTPVHFDDRGGRETFEVFVSTEEAEEIHVGGYYNINFVFPSAKRLTK